MPKVVRFYRNISSDESESIYEQNMHGYVTRKLRDDSNIETTPVYHRLQTGILHSSLKALPLAIKEQEMSTKYLMHKNDNDAGKDVKL